MKDKKLVAIAVPLSNKSFFTENERISLNHLEYHLSCYDIYFVVPDNMEIKRDGYKEIRFHKRFFGSAKAHQNLLFSKQFYQAFDDYKFLLIYHLDALVFSDQLKEWCGMDFDYIAPPWIEHNAAPYHGNPEYEGKVGNGGFSLRKIETFLSVLNSTRLSQSPLAYVRSALKYGSSIRKYSIFLKYPLFFHHKYNGVQRELGSYPHNEDHFWANRAEYYYPGFRVAPVMTAIKFAFECVPRYCFELNGNQLPFGCHAWGRYDRNFWAPHLMS
jgi:hypothetical protein